MKTTTEKQNKKYIRMESASLMQNSDITKASKDETEVEVQIIQMNPSFFGMPGWKFFVVKDKK